MVSHEDGRWYVSYSNTRNSMGFWLPVSSSIGVKMTSNVYFMDLRATYKDNLLIKLGRLMESAGLSRVVKERDLVAVKLHFGELGNTAFVRPVFIREIVKRIKQVQGVPFLTDTNTLYRGSRSHALSHLEVAIKNGFSYSVVDAPVIIADGLRGRSETAVRINQKRFKQAYIASDIAHANAMISFGDKSVAKVGT